MDFSTASRICQGCTKILIPRPREGRAVFQRRKYCSRKCYTKAQKSMGFGFGGIQINEKP